MPTFQHGVRIALLSRMVCVLPRGPHSCYNYLPKSHTRLGPLNILSLPLLQNLYKANGGERRERHFLPCEVSMQSYTQP